MLNGRERPRPPVRVITHIRKLWAGADGATHTARCGHVEDKSLFMTPDTDQHKYSLVKPKHSFILSHLAAAICVTMWGFSFVSSSVLLDVHHMGAVELYIYRFTIAYLLVLAISHKRFRSHSLRDELLFCVCGVTAGSIYFIAENTALKVVSSTDVSLLTSLSPLLTVLLAGVLYNRCRFDWRILLGSGIAFVGVACVIFNSATELDVNPLGDFLSIGAALSWAIYSLVLRRLSANYDVWYATRKTFFYGVLTSIPFLFIMPGNLHNPADFLFSYDALLNLLFLSLGASMTAYLLWAISVKNLGAVTAGNYMYFQTPVTMIAAFFVLNEKITPIGIVGCVLIIGGLWLGDWLSRRHALRTQGR